MAALVMRLIATMVRDVRDLFSLTMHIRKHGL
jgi:hypothetical protein